MSQYHLFQQQTQIGESRWWSWCIAFWFSLLAWFILSGILLSPLSAIAYEIDPEIARQLESSQIGLLTGEDQHRVALLMLGVMVSTVLVGLFWILNRAFKGRTRVVFGYLTGISLIANIWTAGSAAPILMSNSAETNTLTNIIMAQSPLIYLLMLLTFPAFLIGLYMVQSFIHHRPILWLHTAAKKFRWRRAFYAFAVMATLAGALVLLQHVTGISRAEFVFDPSKFFIFAIISLIFIPIQSATEEIVFRGYLNQAFGHFIKSPWIVFIITSLMFAAMHLANPEAKEGAKNGLFLLTMSSYFVFGFIACLLVWMDGGLESAIGMHAGNNVFAAVLVNYQNSALPTPPIFEVGLNPAIDVPLGIAAMILMAVIMWKTRLITEPRDLPVSTNDSLKSFN